MKNARKAVTLVLALFLAVSACSQTGSDLAVVDLHSSERTYDSLEELTDATDAIFHGRLVWVVDATRYSTDDDEGVAAEGVRDEFVGLVFEVLDVVEGSLDGAEVTVDWMGYEVDAESKARRGRYRHNGLDFLAPQNIGQEFLLAISFRDGIGYRAASNTIASVAPDGQLAGLAVPYALDNMGIHTVAELRDRAVANGDSGDGSSADSR